MKELSIGKMEMVSGGSMPGCIGMVAGGIGIAALIIATPATGGLSLAATGWLMTQAMAAGIGTGLSAGDCFFN
ncbi:hypothetical protein J2X69_001397 [Algoriphagus sp. 4150]|uniref:hypothetical protein n=1 Tax=Algoriphagus sp. 4150 TaxID=2817756 RepID=UPI00285ECE0B|nr:hypothetical protein [Algoriphagus sp. 4150]MDR7129062.1 hypothetical protein [Algoriphagus sp. 4150]